MSNDLLKAFFMEDSLFQSYLVRGSRKRETLIGSHGYDLSRSRMKAIVFMDQHLFVEHYSCINNRQDIIVMRASQTLLKQILLEEEVVCLKPRRAVKHFAF